MGFSINPNDHYLKLIKIVQSVNSFQQLKTAERCIDIYDSNRKYFIEYFNNTDELPLVHHMGDYDHDMSMWIIRKKLNYKFNK